MPEQISIFIAGIIQGSLPDTIHAQEYRKEIADLLSRRFPDATIYDPFAEHPDSLRYDPEQGRDVFFDLMDRAGQADLLISFVPQASMGTAIEMWNAFHAGAAVVCVSPLEENWVIRFLADEILPDMPSFKEYIVSGRLEDLLESKIGYEYDGAE